MPKDGVVQVAFDRYLLPVTVSRQAVVLRDANGKPLPPAKLPRVFYDPVARTVTLAPPDDTRPWLEPGQPYTLELPVAEGDDDLGGLRAIDRATLDPNQTRRFDFFIAKDGATPKEPTVSFCSDVMPIFQTKCSAPSCHGAGDKAAEGLVLTTTTGVVNTAIGRVSQEANTGATSRPAAEGRVFGLDMPIVDPGNPGHSWLMYKVEMAELPVVDAGPPSAVQCSDTNGGALLVPGNVPAYQPLAPALVPAPDLARTTLANLVLGREMPYPVVHVGAYADQALTFAEREAVRLWIAQGALVTECGGCRFADLPAPDAGADASADAGADAADAGGDAADASDAADADGG